MAVVFPLTAQQSAVTLPPAWADLYAMESDVYRVKATTWRVPRDTEGLAPAEEATIGHGVVLAEQWITGHYARFLWRSQGEARPGRPGRNVLRRLLVLQRNMARISRVEDDPRLSESLRGTPLSRHRNALVFRGVRGPAALFIFTPPASRRGPITATRGWLSTDDLSWFCRRDNEDIQYAFLAGLIGAGATHGHGLRTEDDGYPVAPFLNATTRTEQDELIRRARDHWNRTGAMSENAMNPHPAPDRPRDLGDIVREAQAGYVYEPAARRMEEVRRMEEARAEAERLGLIDGDSRAIPAAPRYPPSPAFTDMAAGLQRIGDIMAQMGTTSARAFANAEPAVRAAEEILARLMAERRAIVAANAEVNLEISRQYGLRINDVDVSRDDILAELREGRES